MSGRGRPRKEKSPDEGAKGKTRPEETKPARCPLKDLPGEKQRGTAKEQKPREQKKKNHTEERPSAPGAKEEKTAKRTPPDKTKAPVQGAKAKTYADKADTGQQSAEEKKTQPETQKGIAKAKEKKKNPEMTEDTSQDSPKTKAKARGGKAPKNDAGKMKKPEACAEKVLEVKTQPETQAGSPKAKRCRGKTKETEKPPDKMTKGKTEMPEDTSDHSPKTKAKACGGKAIKKVKSAEEAKDDAGEMTKPEACAKKNKLPQQAVEVKTQPETQEGSPKAKRCADKAKSPDELRDKAAVDTILRKTLEKLKIKRNDKSDAAEVVNEIRDVIIKHLKNNSKFFQEVGEPLNTGSYYENLKIACPDEFDVMLPIPVDRAKIEPFGENGAFYSVSLKREKGPLQVFQKDDILSASDMLKEFRKEVLESVKPFTEWEVTKKKKGCPAVTMTTTVKAIPISLDVVLCLAVKSSWPAFTKGGIQIERWLGTKVKKEYKLKPFYLVPKYEGKGTTENDGVVAKDCWRVSFSHIEKAILKNHGSEKTCCEKDGVPCCRKGCLKLLKHLLSLLKEGDSSFDKFCSYHAKTTLLHACCSRTKDTDWRASNLSQCFQLLLDDFVDHLENGELSNFFIPSQNLLSGPTPANCRKLARRLREERDGGFPIFK